MEDNTEREDKGGMIEGGRESYTMVLGEKNC